MGGSATHRTRFSIPPSGWQEDDERFSDGGGAKAVHVVSWVSLSMIVKTFVYKYTGMREGIYERKIGGKYIRGKHIRGNTLEGNISEKIVAEKRISKKNISEETHRS